MELPLGIFKDGTHRGVVALRQIRCREVVLEFEKSFVETPTNKTLRISQDIHQLSRDPSAIENFVNHSCEANAHIDFHTLELKALRNIKKGEEVTYNYFTSDWDGEDAFECHCKSLTCKKYIAGFKHLTLLERLELKAYLSPFLAEKLYEF